MVGFFGAVTGFIDAEALKKAVLDSVPAHTRELNVKAFEAGYEYGKALLTGTIPETAAVHA
jgi:2-oxoglutarate ferredoxin oxidoreductase subunit gamma